MIALVVFVLIVAAAFTLAILQLHATADELRTRIRQDRRLAEERWMADMDKFDAVWDAFGAQADLRQELPPPGADDRTKRRAVSKRKGNGSA